MNKKIMRRLTYLFVILSLIISLTGCGKDTAKVNISSNQSTTSTISTTVATVHSDETSITKSDPGASSKHMSRVSSKSSSVVSIKPESRKTMTSIGTVSIHRSEPPIYVPYHVETTDQFIEWIKTTDPETFKEGYFKPLIDTLRKDKSFYYPYYKGEKLAIQPSEDYTKITIYPDAPNESYGYGFTCLFNNKQYRIELIYLDSSYIQEAKKNLYLYRTGRPIEASVLETDPSWKYVSANKKIVIEDKSSDTWIKQNAPDDNDRAFFLYKNQYVVRVNFVGKEGVENSNRLDEDFLKNLQFKKIKF